jgi:hypothetical protein
MTRLWSLAAGVEMKVVEPEVPVEGTHLFWTQQILVISTGRSESRERCASGVERPAFLLPDQETNAGFSTPALRATPVEMTRLWGKMGC